MRILGVIPARYASTRFPSKPLIDIGGQSMIERVYRQVKKSGSISKVIVATDHHKICDQVITFGGEVRLTSESHASGTDRCFEVLTNEITKFDYVINIQGDEPFIAPKQIDLLAALLDGKTELATLAKKIEDSEQLFNSNIVKIVLDKNWNALYFSRSAIPHLRNIAPDQWLRNHTFYKHIGMYAYRADILEKITKLNMSLLEKAESLEQLRWLENGYSIKVAETMDETIGIDTPEDLEKALLFLRKK